MDVTNLKIQPDMFGTYITSLDKVPLGLHPVTVPIGRINEPGRINWCENNAKRPYVFRRTEDDMSWIYYFKDEDTAIMFKLIYG